MQIPFQPSIRNKVAVVTGGAGVLCSMFAKALAQAGARVAILDLSLEGAGSVADAINEAGGEAIAVEANVLKRDSVASAHRQVLDAFGPCDILLNGAGGNHPKATTDDEFYSKEIADDPEKKSFFDIDEAGFTFVFGLNLVGTFLPTQEFAKDMLGRTGCSIINISSMAAFCPLTKAPAYAAAKAGISNLTQWLSVYFAGEGIRVNAIAPGFFSTAQNAALLWNADGTPTPRTGKIIAHTPMKRFGEPQELIGTLLYLTDERCSGFVTGVVIPVDGGFLAYSGV